MVNLSASFQDLLNFVAANGFLIDEYKVFSGWPRRDLTAIDASQTLEALKLYPQETVILEERFWFWLWSPYTAITITIIASLFVLSFKSSRFHWV